MSTDLLFLGDLHLGRRPTRLMRSDLDPRLLSPAVAWERAVDHALEQRVAAVVLAGDLVDDERDRFEAYGRLERGVQRLVTGGVAVVAVAGNHDGLVLPRLADRIPALTLLGRGGRWEHLALGADPPVDLLGWSFPAAHHRASPLESPGLEAALGACRPDAARIGVLHADLDVTSSAYAPVASEALRHLDVDAWLLGHIHRPSPLEQRPLGYLGSLVGLDRGERGWHGPWLARVQGRGDLALRPISLGPLRWEEIPVDVSAIPDDDGAEDALHAAVERAFRVYGQRKPALADPRWQVVACSVTLTGRAPARRRMLDILERIEHPNWVFERDGQRWALVDVHDATQPAVDLAALARQHNPLGQLAAILQRLEAGDPLPPALQARLQPAVRPFNEGRWRLEGDPWTDEDTRRALREAAWRLMDELLQQQRQQD